MNYAFFTNIQEKLLDFGTLVIDIFDTKLSEILPPGASTFLTPDILDMNMMSFLLSGGITVIIAWNLAKWALPFLK